MTRLLHKVGLSLIILSTLLFSSCQKHQEEAEFIWLQKTGKENREVLAPHKFDGKHYHLVFFISRRCPVSNNYIKEIRKIINTYNNGYIVPYIVYTDPRKKKKEVITHLNYHRFKAHAVLDSRHLIVDHAGVQVTPSTALYNSDGELLYRGRIDDWYIDLDKHRYEPNTRDLRDVLNKITTGAKVNKKFTEAIGCQIKKY